MLTPFSCAPHHIHGLFPLRFRFSNVNILGVLDLILYSSPGRDQKSRDWRGRSTRHEGIYLVIAMVDACLN